MLGERMNKSAQSGLSLVELMVAILIGLIILAGVIQVVFTSRATYMGQEEMSFVQENARYAVDVIGRDIQSAGHWGCAGPMARSAFVGRVEPDAALFMARRALDGFDGGASNAPAAYRDGIREATDSLNADIAPDSFLLRGFRGQTYTVAQHVTNNNGGTLQLREDHPFRSGNYVGVVEGDCRRIGVFRAGAVNGTSITYGAGQNFTTAIKSTVDADILCNSITSANEDDATVVTANCKGAQNAGQVYTSAATVMPYSANAYYVGNSTILGNDLPALRRAVLRNGTVVDEEIALGVENMQIRYGEFVGTDLVYRRADAVEDWGNVASVQVDLLFRSQTPVLPQAQEQPEMLGNTYNDRFARQVVSSTFRLRNRF